MVPLIRSRRLNLTFCIIFQLSYCIRRAPWKPVVLIQLSIGTDTNVNDKNVTIMERLVSSAKIPLDSNIFIFTKQRSSVSVSLPLRSASAVEQNSTLVFWEVYTIKQIPFIHKLSIDATAASNSEGFEILTFLRGVACRRSDFHRVAITGVTQVRFTCTDWNSSLLS